jgi:hypothetical protein
MWNDIKAMETGTLGTSGINKNDGIDCHMSKNSEWGAALLLTISAYGAGSAECVKSTSISSTGNASGVYQLASGTQWTAAYNITGTTDAVSFFNGLDSKYVDKYSTDNLATYNASASKIKGDALFAKGFLGSTGAYLVGSSDPVA